jgi:hypothetical protein
MSKYKMLFEFAYRQIGKRVHFVYHFMRFESLKRNEVLTFLIRFYVKVKMNSNPTPHDQKKLPHLKP